MFGRSKIWCATFTLASLLLCTSICAELMSNADNVDAINSLYENLLQREYAGPVIFPSHQMERKAQRSPSLRLRFGRRSDPDGAVVDAQQQQQQHYDEQTPLVGMEKRWWGDVNQKPIRSPSLRLRFGKRQSLSGGNDVAARNNYDALLHDLAAIEENLAADYSDYENGGGGAGLYERVVRKPQRLRWGRSVLPALAPANAAADNALFNGNSNNNNNIADLEQQQLTVAHDEKWRNLLMALGGGAYDGLVAGGGAAAMVDNNADDEFQREVRKPGGPLRLRWGRSTGGRSSSSSSSSASGSGDSKTDMNLNGKSAQSKKSLGSSVLTAPKAVEQQQQQQQLHQSVAK